MQCLFHRVKRVQYSDRMLRGPIAPCVPAIWCRCSIRRLDITAITVATTTITAVTNATTATTVSGHDCHHCEKTAVRVICRGIDGHTARLRTQTGESLNSNSIIYNYLELLEFLIIESAGRGAILLTINYRSSRTARTAAHTDWHAQACGAESSVREHTGTRAHVREHTRAHAHVRAHTHSAHSCTHTSARARTHAQARTPAREHARTQARMHACTHAHLDPAGRCCTGPGQPSQLANGRGHLHYNAHLIYKYNRNIY
jgi:hypothetical protein